MDNDKLKKSPVYVETLQGDVEQLDLWKWLQLDNVQSLVLTDVS